MSLTFFTAKSNHKMVVRKILPHNKWNKIIVTLITDFVANNKGKIAKRPQMDSF